MHCLFSASSVQFSSVCQSRQIHKQLNKITMCARRGEERRGERIFGMKEINLFIDFDFGLGALSKQNPNQSRVESEREK